MQMLTQALRLPQLDISRVLLLVSLGLTLFYNQAFYRNAGAVFAGSAGGLAFMVSLAVFLFALTLLLLSLLCVRFLTKPVLAAVVLAAAGASVYMDAYNIVIDTTMITNIMKTDAREVGDLLDVGLIARLLLLGVVPALLIWTLPIRCTQFSSEVVRRLKLVGLALLLMLAAIAPFTPHYTSFFREHKLLRYYANPATPLYSAFRYASDTLAATDARVRQVLGLDARIPLADTSRELVILVVGEAARADHFGLNGYSRNTTPLLAQENLINFPQVSSCGTATAYSLPCMFDAATRADFELDEGRSRENALDVLRHAGVNVLWRDNNSDSKGVATAVEFEDFRSAERNPVCDEECRDVGMLQGLDDYIAAHPRGDIVIVLHQMGNHGPAYHKRYPAEFERFTPACHSNRLEDCSDLEIGNAYDNAILYTDWFLVQVIGVLKQHNSAFETAMYYMADHGESLGEAGLYLHGLPYLLAPEAQKHVASLLWFGDSYRVDRAALRKAALQPLSHDNYFHTVLGLLEIESAVHKPELDLLADRH
jgi:lipid A ethanolaminephosphotransferase